MTTATWKGTKLGHWVETQKGFAFKSGWYCNVGRPIVKVSDFTRDSMNSSNLVCISETIASNYLKYELKTGDVVVQTVGSWPSNPASVVGKCVKVPAHAAGALLNQNAVKLSPKEGLDHRFLFCLLRSPHFKNYIVGTAQGAASQAAITLDAIRGYEFKLPSLREQRRIASIVGAYDELIEVNQRRVVLLEEMARWLFEEWFVHLGGPQPRPSAAQLSVKRTLSDIIEFEKGRKPVTVFDNQTEQTVPQLLIDVLRGGSPKFVEPDGMVLARADDTIMVMDGSGSSEVFIGHAGAIGSTLGRYRCRPNVQPTPYWLYLLLASKAGELKSKNTGAAVPHANKEYIARIEFYEPAADVSQRFEYIVRPKFEMIATLAATNSRLAASRDLLLPRLISGALSVSAAGQELEAVA